eukprot:6182283-Pleurochrysis_carterae.AAC.6
MWHGGFTSPEFGDSNRSGCCFNAGNNVQEEGAFALVDMLESNTTILVLETGVSQRWLNVCSTPPSRDRRSHCTSRRGLLLPCAVGNQQAATAERTAASRDHSNGTRQPSAPLRYPREAHMAI